MYTFKRIKHDKKITFDGKEVTHVHLYGFSTGSNAWVHLWAGNISGWKNSNTKLLAKARQRYLGECHEN